MKANAPEKIYSIPTEGGFYLTAIKPEPPFAYGIEYTQTNAFIEKAKKWFEQQPELYDANGVRCYSIEDFEDFVNYMKGE